MVFNERIVLPIFCQGEDRVSATIVIAYAAFVLRVEVSSILFFSFDS